VHKTGYSFGFLRSAPPHARPNRLASLPTALARTYQVTASHNPKKDNGYKVYWENGSQIIPPHDAGIAATIERNLEPWQVRESRGVCVSVDLWGRF